MTIQKITFDSLETCVYINERLKRLEAIVIARKAIYDKY